MIEVSKTFKVITEESLENGETADRGFIYQDQRMNMDQVLYEVQNGGPWQWSSSHPATRDWITTVEPDYVRGREGETFYSLHFKGLSDRQFQKLLQATK